VCAAGNKANHWFLLRALESFARRPELLTANHCKAAALPLAWSSSSQTGDGLFNPQDSLTYNGERIGGKRLEHKEKTENWCKIYKKA